MKIVECKVYSFDELDDQAKAKAIDNAREGDVCYDWWDSTYEDFVECLKRLGFAVDPKSIAFSGFYCQGSGACFDADYEYRPGWRAAIADHCPNEKDLIDIGRRLQAIQRPYFYQLEARIKGGDRGYWTNASVYDKRDGREPESDEPQEDIRQCASELADWLYYRLEKEYEWLTSDEQVADRLRSNEVEFNEDGTTF